ncbi:MAG: hypothetical protein RL274_1737 [Pseudomonadota bacterium]|jgi:hypothetical protein
MRRIMIAGLMLAASHGTAFAWGAAGHRMIGELAAKNFPVQIPAFLRTPQARFQIGQLAREPDISKGAGQPHDADLDPGHYVNVSDDGTIRGGPKLSDLPATRRDYDTALRAAGTNQYAVGYLPYNLMGGYQQLVKDFAILRMTMAAQKYARQFSMTSEERRRFAREHALREMLTLRDLGWWAHFVGDTANPMHATIHLNGWRGDSNPRGFTTARGTHAKFEEVFVNANIADADVAARLRPYRACACTIAQRTQDYLAASWALVVPTYELEKSGALDTATPESSAFVAERLAEGASQLRDWVTDAWDDSAKATLGYRNPMSVADLESGKADPHLLN